MNTGRIILDFQLRHAVRSRWLLLYGGSLLVLTTLLIWFGGTAEHAVVSLLNVVLLLVPLIALLYGVLGISQAREFLELMLAQPLERRVLFWGVFTGMAAPLALIVPVSFGIPWLLGVRQLWGVYATLAGGSIALTLIGTAFGMAFALRWDDRLRAFGMTVALWFLLAVVYDAVILVLGITLRDYPIEHGLLVLLFLNPIDLVRVATLLQLDAAALLGYTGALLQHFVGNIAGIMLTIAALLLWTLLPLALAMRSFVRKDF